VSTLLQISDDLRALAALFEEQDGELSADTDAALESWFAELEAKSRDKIDNYVALIESLSCRAIMRDTVINRLQKLANADAVAAKQLKDRLKLFFEQQGLKSVDTARYHLSLCGNGGKAPLEIRVPVGTLPVKYQVVRVDADTEAIRGDLESGVDVPGCSLKPRGTALRIR
jgi:hypothetical protein